MSDNQDDRTEEQGAGGEALSDEDRLASLLYRGHAALSDGRPQEAEEHLEEAIVLARKLEDSAAEASACGLVAQALLRLGENEEAASRAEVALQIATARSDEEAMKHFRQLLVTCHASPEEIAMSSAFGDGREALQQGDLDRAVERLSSALETARELGHRVAEGAASHLLGQAYLSMDDAGSARPHARRAVELAEETGDEDATIRSKALLDAVESPEPTGTALAAELQWGQSALAGGDFERGVRHLERALLQAEKEREPIPEASARGLLAQALLELDRRDEAEAHAKRALEIAEELGHAQAAESFRALLAATQADSKSHDLARELHLGMATLETGSPEDAVKRLRKALAIAESSEHEVGVALAATGLARAYDKLGRPEEARPFVDRAKRIAERHGDAAALARLESLLADD